jgi:flavin-binding protein dodecin
MARVDIKSNRSGMQLFDWGTFAIEPDYHLVPSRPFDGGIRRKRSMKNHVYKILELVGSSETSIEEAISTAVAQASKTGRNMDWFEVVHTRGHIENGKIGHYQVTLKIGFTLET